MTGYKKSPHEFTIGELDRELIARGALLPMEQHFKMDTRIGIPMWETGKDKSIQPLQAPTVNPALRHLTTWELTKYILKTTREINDKGEINDKACRGHLARKDYYQITNNRIKENSRCVVSIWMKENVIDNNDGTSTLEHKNFGESHNLSRLEPFRNQPVAAGRLCTGFLVKDDVIATAGHCANERNVKDLRIVFVYKMTDEDTPVTQVPNENIYKGVEIVNRGYDPHDSKSDCTGLGQISRVWPKPF